MHKHAYLPTTHLSDKGSAFVSHVIKEVVGALGITLKLASKKTAQTLGLLPTISRVNQTSIED